MSKMYLNGEEMGGTFDQARMISCLDSNGNESTVQYELDRLGGLRFGKDGDGNGGYYGADGSFIPFLRTYFKEFVLVSDGTSTTNINTHYFQ